MAIVLDQLDPAAEGTFENESRILFTPAAPPFPHVVFSGSVSGLENIYGNILTDDDSRDTEVHLVVGPWWKHLQNVVAHVAIGEYYSSNPDQDDFMRWGSQKVRFTEKLGEIGTPNAGEKRIQLEFVVRLQGQHSSVRQINYYVTAVGRTLGAGGIQSP
jgi:hypothetical protein